MAGSTNHHGGAVRRRTDVPVAGSVGRLRAVCCGCRRWSYWAIVTAKIYLLETFQLGGMNKAGQLSPTEPGILSVCVLIRRPDVAHRSG
jgi:hypothetical protein